MNRWKCQAAGCQSVCMGVGGAVGLRALGWYCKVRGSYHAPSDFDMP